LLLEELAPEIVNIKGIHNTVANAISWLDYNPTVNPTSKCNHAMLGVSEKREYHCQMEDLLKTLALLQ
jgi:hypothetical protein